MTHQLSSGYRLVTEDRIKINNRTWEIAQSVKYLIGPEVGSSAAK